jgi:NAD(P)-dependent dehydrogenase (short-subunit alcohol dehydrogenase family)
MLNLTDRVFIVTGATGDLGQAVTRALRRSGAMLALVDRAIEKRFPEVFPEMVDLPDPVLVYAADLTDPEAVVPLASAVIEHFGRIDGLLNIVGGYRAGTPVHETDISTFDFMFNLNARTVFLMCHAVIPHMIRQKGGKIVNIGARVAYGARKNMAAYSVAKTAVVRLTESISAEVKDYGINVNAVLPGTIDTPQNRAEMPNANVARWVQPEELADVILFLVSDEARAVHGAAIPVYGTG